MEGSAAIRVRRLCSLLAVCVVVVALPKGFGHRGVHAVRSLLFPGAGLYDHRNGLLGATFTVAAIAATILWIRWGMDWLVGVVVLASMVTAGALAYVDDPTRLTHVAAAHEFPLVILVMGALSSMRLAWRRSTLGRWHAARARSLGRVELSLIDQCRVVSINGIAEVGTGLAPLELRPLVRRCRRVGIAARGRCTGDPMRADHAHVRTALLLSGQLQGKDLAQFRADASQAHAGVPASEPGWVRLLDGTLAACALQMTGEPALNDALLGARWSAALHGPLALRHGHRPAAVWTPLAVRGPRSSAWEHATATGLARRAGWLHNDDDWHALRKRALAAAARGNCVADDERLVAASRIWLACVDDEPASRILGRVTIINDPIAVALDTLADSFKLKPTPFSSNRGNRNGLVSRDSRTLQSTRRTP